MDILSGGRVYWGAGRGFDPKEFRTFGMTPEEGYRRFQEAVDIVVSAWRNQRLTYQGKYYSFDNIEVLPKPVCGELLILGKSVIRHEHVEARILCADLSLTAHKLSRGRGFSRPSYQSESPSRASDVPTIRALSGWQTDPASCKQMHVVDEIRNPDG